MEGEYGNEREGGKVKERGERTHQEAAAGEGEKDEGAGEVAWWGHENDTGGAAERACGGPPGLPPDDGMSPTDM